MTFRPDPGEGGYYPGEQPSMEYGDRRRRRSTDWVTAVCASITFIALGGWAYFVLFVWNLRDFASLSWAFIGTVLYLSIAFAFHPKPDYDDLGWCGGLFNNPFRFSDNINRNLLALEILLWPGRFMSESLVDACKLLFRSNARKKRKRKPWEGEPPGFE